MAQQYTAGQLLVPVRPDTSGAVTSVRKEFATMPDPVVRVEADIRSLQKDKAKALAELDQLRATKADPKVGLQIGELEAKKAQVEARLSELGKLEPTPKVAADIQVAQARIATIDDQIGRLEAKRADPKIDANISSAENRIASIDSRMDQLTAQRRDIQAGVDDTEVGTGMARIGAKVSAGADSVKGTLREKLGGAVGSTVGGELGEGISSGFSSKAAIAGAAGLAIGGALAYGISQAMTVEQGRAKLNVQLGLVGEDAASYGRIAGNLYSQAYGESMDQVNEALKTVTQNIGALDDPSLERVSGKVLNLSTAFGVDLQGATAAVGTMMRTGMAPNADAALDIITAGMQGGADKAGDLLDTLTEYPAQFQKLGIDGQAATGLITQGLAAGARSSDLVADALKEFSIRAIDGSKLTAEGFAAVGLNAQDMAAKIARGGPEAAGALDLTLDRLRAMPDPVARSQAAVALFGTQAEDLGASLFALDPSNAVNTLGQVAGVADQMGQTLGETGSARIESFKRSLQTGLVDFIGGSVLPIFDVLGSVGASLFGDAWGPVKDFLGFLAGTGGTIAAVIAVIAGVTWAWTAASAALNTTFLANPVFWVIAGIVALVAVVIYAWNHFDWFRNAVSTVWSAIAAGATWLWSNIFQPVFSAIGAIFMWLWSSIISPVVGWIASQWSWLSIVIGILVGPIGWVVLAFTTFREQTMAVLAAVGGALLWLWQSIFVPAFTAIGAVATWLWTNVLSPVLSAIWTGLAYLGAIIFTILVAPFIIAWNLIAAIATWAWSNVLQPLWYGAIMPALSALGAFFTWLWQAVVVPVWNGIVAAVLFAWGILQAIWYGALVPALQFVGSIFTWLWVNVVQPIWTFIQAYIAAQVAALQYLWNTILVPALQFVGSIFTWLYQNVVLPIWTALGNTIQFVWANIIKPAFDAVWGGLQWLGDRFRDGVGFIERVWNTIRGILAKPINFMINTVWNGGILAAWNKVAGLLGIGELAPLAPIPEFAGGGRPVDATPGGQMRGPGTGTSDDILARVSNREFVVREKVADRVTPFLAALNRGDGEALQAAGAGAARVKTFSGRSGLGLNPQAGVPRIPGYAMGGPIEERINAAKAWLSGPARGAPYVYGGGTNPRAGMDCSSMQSAVTHILSGRPPDSGRIGATSTMPWGGFVGGINGQYAVGNKPNDHMAGTLAGQNVEQHGPNGTPFSFPSRWGADNGYFPQKYHLGEVGGSFVSGGAGGGGSWFNPLPGLVKAAFALTEIPLKGLKALVGDPPPEYRRVPVGLAYKMRDSLRDFLVQKAELAGPSDGMDTSGISGPVVDQVRAVAQRFGWDQGAEWDAIAKIVQKESSWDPGAASPISSARGLFQKMTSLNGPVEPTPAGQAAWGLNYIRGRYKTPTGAWAWHQSHNWYDDGGVATGKGIMFKNVMAPERVLSPEQTESYDTLGTLVRELEAGRLPGPAPTLTRAAIDSMAASSSSTTSPVPTSIDAHLYDTDGVLLGTIRGEVDDGMSALASALNDGSS